MSETDPPLTRMQMLEQIAELESQLAENLVRTRSLREETSRIDKDRTRMKAEKARLEERLAAMRQGIVVSDHALVRYLERRYGFDSEAIREEILTPAVRAAVNAGAAGVQVEGGTFKIEGRTLTTFFTGKEPRGR